jgi:Leucine-rich repeat (LRR) protein
MGVDKSIGNLVNLEILDIGCNSQIRELPLELENLKNLKNVNLDNIGLLKFPEYITKCCKIERLRLSNNKINELPNNIENLKCIKSLNLINCNLQNIIPKIGMLQTLNELFLNNNELIDIPNEMENLLNLQYLDLSNNQLQQFPNIFTKMKQLIVLNIFSNNITSINANIIYAINLQNFNIEDNPIIEIDINVMKFINTMFNKKTIINDVQNIHSSSIQKNTVTSIENIMKIVRNINITDIIVISQIMSDKVLSTECKLMISKEFHKHESLITVNMTFKQLFFMVWKYIHMDNLFTINVQNEIKKILSIDMTDSKDLCFVGKITRIIGCLNGFSNIVQITISEAEEIGIIISKIEKNLIAKNNYTTEKHYNIALEELRNMNFKEETIQEWIQYIIS